MKQVRKHPITKNQQRNASVAEVLISFVILPEVQNCYKADYKVLTKLIPSWKVPNCPGLVEWF